MIPWKAQQDVVVRAGKWKRGDKRLQDAQPLFSGSKATVHKYAQAEFF